jgi:acyl dehydratase
MTGRYLEDFAVGQTFGSGRLRVEKERIKAFAAEFDPQPFHLDEEAARSSIFRGLAASGWHTAAMTMRLLVESELKPAGGIVGAGFDEFRWPRPVRPGDELHLESEVLEVRPSKSRPEQGSEDDDEESERRAGAGLHRQSRRAAPSPIARKNTPPQGVLTEGFLGILVVHRPSWPVPGECFLHIPPGFLLMPRPVALQLVVFSRNLGQFPDPPDRQSCGFDVRL